MAEVRSVSSTGGEKGVKEERYDLLPKPGLDAIARVFAFGAEKYASHNWRRGYEWGKSYAALQRHLTAFWEGETNDPESGLPHLGHAGFHILALLTWLEQQGEGGEFDDRYVPTHRAGPVVDWRDPEPITLSGIVDSREALRRFFGDEADGIVHHVAYVEPTTLTPTFDVPLTHFIVNEGGEITETEAARAYLSRLGRNIH